MVPVPACRRTACNSANGSPTASNTRCAETLPLKRVWGGSLDSSGLRSPDNRVFNWGTSRVRSSGRLPTASAPSDPRRRTVSNEKRASDGSLSTFCSTAREYSSARLGSRSAVNPPTGPSSSSTASGVSECSALSNSVPDSPSMIAWCILVYSAKLPAGTPSTLCRPSMM